MAIELGALELAVRDKGGAEVLKTLEKVDAKAKETGKKPVEIPVKAPGAPETQAALGKVKTEADKARQPVTIPVRVDGIAAATQALSGLSGRIGQLASGLGFDSTRAGATARLQAFETYFAKQLQATNLPLQTRIGLEQQLATVRAALATQTAKATPQISGFAKALDGFGMSLKGALGFAGGAAAIGGVVAFLSDIPRAFNEAESAQRRLNAVSKLTGASLADIRAIAERAQMQFGMTAGAASEFTAQVVKLTSRAGALNQSGAFLNAWLDLAAANGLNAADAMQALQTTIIGQDEGLNRLGLSNPQQIYERWAKAAGTTAAKMDDAQKALAILNEVTTEGGKVSGEYAKRMDTMAGSLDKFGRAVTSIKEALGGLAAPMVGFVADVGASFLNFWAEAIKKIDAAGIRLSQIVPRLAAGGGLLGAVADGLIALQGRQKPAPTPSVVFRDVTGAPMTPPAPKPTGTGATGGAARDPNATLADRVRALDQIAALGGLTGADLALAVQLQAQLNAQLAAGNLTLERRAEVLQQLEALGGIVPKIDPAEIRDIAGAGPTAAPTTMEVPVELKPIPTADTSEMEAAGLDLGGTLGMALAMGITQAFQSGSIGEGLKGIGQVVLGAIGDMFIQIGTTALAGALQLKVILASLASLNPFAMAAAGVALIAIGAALKGAASGAVSRGTGGAIGGGGSGAGGSLSATYRIADPSIRRAFLPPNARGTNAPPQAMPQGPPITVIGVNSPQGQRLLGESYNQFNRRGGRG